jgi:hypothetical protein
VIVYNLVCNKGHEFEGWFKDSAAFDSQAAKGVVVCPVCQSRKVAKGLMAPNLGKGTRKGAPEPQTAPAPMAAKMPPQGLDPRLEKLMGEVRTHVEKNYDYVGERFPEEARKIHYGETEERRIYGEASGEEVKALIEEGVEVAPLPPLPRRNS